MEYVPTHSLVSHLGDLSRMKVGADSISIDGNFRTRTNANFKVGSMASPL